MKTGVKWIKNQGEHLFKMLQSADLFENYINVRSISLTVIKTNHFVLQKKGVNKIKLR